MRSELKKYSSIGNFSGIILLCQHILTQQKVHIPSVISACAFRHGCDLNINCGLLAFEEIGLISVENDFCHIRDPFFQSLSQEEAIVKLCQKCFSFLIENTLVDIKDLKFNEQAEMFYIPKHAFRLSAAVFRNLLITFNALVPKGGEFRIANDYDKFFENLVSYANKKLTLDNLQKELLRQQEIGEEGELFVLRFEKSRCPFSESAIKRIRQISHIDVSAGYDIISFHDENSNRRRYIEVKTFRGEPHFYWSSNEIKAAKLRAGDYCVYLVNYDKIGMPDYSPIILRNPYKVINESDLWQSTPQSFLIELKDIGVTSESNLSVD